MSFTRAKIFWAAAAMVATALPAPLPAQTATTSNGANSAEASLVPPPPLPPAKAPVSVFRDLLAMTLQERKQFLANRTAEARNAIEKKIKEYEALPQEQRDLRLLVTELRYFLLPLMANPSTNRSEQVALIPADIRPLVQARLEHWDELPPEKQKELLDNEAAIRSLIYFGSITPVQPWQVPTNVPTARNQELLESLRKWQQLNESQREAIGRRFEEYFVLRPDEQVRVLGMLSEEERRQIETTLESLKNLDQVRRVQLIRALNKFSDLSPSELQEFLRSADRWASLSPAQRKAWRSLFFIVSHEPPLPPGLRAPNLPRVPPPPLPPPPTRSMPVATNE